MEPACGEYQRLASAVGKAVNTVYSMKREQREAINHKNHEKASRFVLLLVEARTAERHAEKLLREHMDQHGCMLKAAPSR